MSLKVFHIVFVIVTIVLSLYVALWGIQQGAIMLSVLFLFTAVALMIYGKKAFRKLRDLP